MKPFEINRTSWHYKLNRYFLNEHGFSERSMEYAWEPRNNNFCAYWCSTVTRLIVLAISIVIVSALLLFLGMVIYNEPYEFFMFISCIVGIIVSMAIMLTIGEYFSKKSKTESKNIFIQKYKSYKSKICPMVEYKE